MLCLFSDHFVRGQAHDIYYCTHMVSLTKQLKLVHALTGIHLHVHYFFFPHKYDTCSRERVSKYTLCNDSDAGRR